MLLLKPEILQKQKFVLYFRRANLTSVLLYRVSQVFYLLYSHLLVSARTLIFISQCTFCQILQLYHPIFSISQ